MKAAIIILSDPKDGDEALGRVFNAMATAYDYQQQGDEVTLIFHGAGTRWIGELSKTEHPAYALFEAVKQSVAGASSGCADVFGTTEEIKKSGFDLLTGNPVPGTSGLPSLHSLSTNGYTIITF